MTLTFDTLPDDPFALFANWLAEASQSEPSDPEAMALATASPDGRPSVRVVLCKGHDARGFVFYSNAESRKGQELAANPQAHIDFHWKSLRRQVRAEGRVEPVSAAEADAYFASRPRASQIGAWASEQSRELRERATLERRIEAFELQFKGRTVTRPPHWGGWRIVPLRIEFWVDRRDRLHERYIYSRPDVSAPWEKGMTFP